MAATGFVEARYLISVNRVSLFSVLFTCFIQL